MVLCSMEHAFGIMCKQSYLVTIEHVLAGIVYRALRGILYDFFFIILTLSGLVSFQKGCYVGQELTARTYHTGVIRKRLMPVKLTQTSTKEVFYLDKDTKVATTSGKLAGKIISVYNNLALGLMRLDIIKSEEELTVALSDKKATNVTVDWPTWWNLG